MTIDDDASAPAPYGHRSPSRAERRHGFGFTLPDRVLDDPGMRAALATGDLCEVITLACRRTPASERVIAQAIGTTSTRVSDYIHRRKRPRQRHVVARIANGLGIPGALLGVEPAEWETLDQAPEPTAGGEHTTASDAAEHDEVAIPCRAPDGRIFFVSISRRALLGHGPSPDRTNISHQDSAVGRLEAEPSRHVPSLSEAWRSDAMERRGLLRLVSTTSAILALPLAENGPGRPSHSSGAAVHAADTLVGDYELTERQLWSLFRSASAKKAVFPLVRAQLEVLTHGLRHARSALSRDRFCALLASQFQLAGEICFDAEQHVEAAHCYALAASAAKEIDAFDLWSCAIIRHALISVHERAFTQALPMLDLARRLAGRGDSQLATRQWASAAQAEAFAGLGDAVSCERALAGAAEASEGQQAESRNEWLRFDGSRMAELRGACYVELGETKLAEPALWGALTPELTIRRRGALLTDLARSAVQRRDIDAATRHADDAISAAARSNSGYLDRKLRHLQQSLRGLPGDREIAGLSERIDALRRAPTR